MDEREMLFSVHAEIYEHYGYKEITDSCGIGVWDIDEHTLERLTLLPEMLDPTKRFRVTFDYDPNFKKALLLLWEFTP